jgi:hypothetical protein
MEKETAKTYKSLQKTLGTVRSKWLDIQIGLILSQTRALSAMSIAKISS